MAVNMLLSYAFHADTNLAAVRQDLVCGLLLVDSGAFTAFTKGRTVNLNGYASYLEKWAGCWDHAVTLDVIGDAAETAKNTRQLHERGIPVMPVFTKGATLAEFDAMVRDVGYVCVGGLVGAPTDIQRKRVRMLQRRAQDAGGGIHALGVGSLATLRAARPYSADASSVSGAFRFGTVVYFTGRDIRNTPVTNRVVLLRDRDHLLAHGVDLALIARTGRLPGHENGSRQLLMKAMSLAYAAADEHLKRTGPVPPPRLAGRELLSGTHLYNSVSDHSGEWQSVVSLDRQLHSGPHLYNSVTPQFGLQPASGLDRALHGSNVPPIWRTYGATHVCWRKGSHGVNPDPSAA